MCLTFRDRAIERFPFAGQPSKVLFGGIDGLADAFKPLFGFFDEPVEPFLFLIRGFVPKQPPPVEPQLFPILRQRAGRFPLLVQIFLHIEKPESEMPGLQFQRAHFLLQEVTPLFPGYPAFTAFRQVVEQSLQPIHREAFDAVSLQPLQNGLTQCRVLLQKRTPLAFGAHGFLFGTVLVVEGGLQGQFQPVRFVPGLLPCRHVGLQPGVLLFSLLQDAFSQPLLCLRRFPQILERKEQGGRKRLLWRGGGDGGMCQRGEAFAHVRFVFGQCGGFFLQLFRHPFPFTRQPGEIALEGGQSCSGAFQFFLKPRKMFLRPGGGGHGKSGEGVFRGSA